MRKQIIDAGSDKWSEVGGGLEWGALKVDCCAIEVLNFVRTGHALYLARYGLMANVAVTMGFELWIVEFVVY